MSLAADLILTGGKLVTLDPAAPHATAIAVRRGVIERVGSDAAVLATAGPQTRCVDLGGRTLLPGFHDCHLHLLWYGLLLTTQVDLVGSQSVDELLDRLRAGPRHGGWIRGHGFEQDMLRERRFPTRAELDRLGDEPIIVSRICGHAAVVNSAALARVGKPSRSGGDPERGLYTETAITPFYDAIGAPDDATNAAALDAAMNVALRSGITSVQTLLDTPQQMQAYTAMRRRLGRLPVRVVAMPPHAAAESLRQNGIATGFGDDFLTVGGAKFFSDGSLGARTAWLESPYADYPSTRGQRIHEPRMLAERCRVVADAGFQLVIHAIGDAALRESIDAIEHALDGRPNVMRHRVEHASVCPPREVDRLARLQIPVSLQPQFVTSDTWTGDRLGDARRVWAYPFETMRRSGIAVGLSSDCPVEKLDGRSCLHAAVQRHDWSPEEKLSRYDAIDAYCRGSAFLGHTERRVGQLRDGMAADFVVVDQDPLAESTDLRGLAVRYVYVGGRRVESAGSQAAPETGR